MPISKHQQTVMTWWCIWLTFDRPMMLKMSFWSLIQWSVASVNLTTSACKNYTKFYNSPGCKHFCIFCKMTISTSNSSFCYPGWGPDPNFCLIRLSRPKIPLIRLYRPKVFWSDHLKTTIQTQIRTIAQTLIRLWSDSSALEEVMIRPSCARSIYGQTQFRLQLFMTRLKCARNKFRSESNSLEIVWSEKNFTYEKISQFCYNIFFSWKLMFAVFNSSKEKSIIKVLLKETKPNCWEQILFSAQFSVYFWLNGWV